MEILFTYDFIHLATFFVGTEQCIHVHKIDDLKLSIFIDIKKYLYQVCICSDMIPKVECKYCWKIYHVERRQMLLYLSI